MVVVCVQGIIYMRKDEKRKLEIEGEWGWLVGPNDVVISYLFGRPIILIHEFV